MGDFDATCAFDYQKTASNLGITWIMMKAGLLEEAMP